MVRETQGLAELPYNGTSVGSLVPEQTGLIDALLNGSWRTLSQNDGTMGGVDSATPNQTVKSVAAVAAEGLPKWIIPVVGIALVLLLLKGK